MASTRLTIDVCLQGLLRARGFFAWLWERIGASGPAANDERWNQ